MGGEHSRKETFQQLVNSNSEHLDMSERTGGECSRQYKIKDSILCKQSKLCDVQGFIVGERELCGVGDLPEPRLHLAPREALEGSPVQGHLPQLCHLFLEP